MNKNELLEMISGLEEEDYTIVETKVIVKKLMAYAKLLDSAFDLVEAVSEYMINQSIIEKPRKRIVEGDNIFEALEKKMQQSMNEIITFRADRLKSHKATFEEIRKGTLNG